ncbi:aspartate racemase/maleate isomerase family protein [Amycolatopsis pithecellobii]|uniref:Asp/Glu racemase n=1 Tax=Amycolatopsis pithecellobii TaxID=664692 RepID=A0A6N7YN00_9PSEU|nr:hypothetical protein [Amycolatopsis pithecellobii]MTD54345.1 hypothetical protein [Amycolatopsis pithecellobii]
MTPRIGLLVPSSNPTLAADLRSALGTRATVDVEPLARHEPVTPEGELKMVGDDLPRAAVALAARRPDVVIVGCSSAAALLGHDGEQDLCDDLRGTTGVPVIGANQAFLASLRRNAIKRPVLLTPYEWPLTLTLRGELLKQHVEVVLTACLEIAGTAEITAISPAQITEFALAHVDPSGDGVMLAGCALRSREALADISREAGVPAVSVNSALIEKIELWLAKHGGDRV